MSELQAKAANYDYVWKNEDLQVYILTHNDTCGIGIVMNGRGIVKPAEEWHKLATIEEEQEEPEAYLIVYRETTKYGSVSCVTMASLLPEVPSLFLPEDSNIEERKLISVTPLYGRSTNLPKR